MIYLKIDNLTNCSVKWEENIFGKVVRKLFCVWRYRSKQNRLNICGDHAWPTIFTKNFIYLHGTTWTYIVSVLALLTRFFNENPGY